MRSLAVIIFALALGACSAFESVPEAPVVQRCPADRPDAMQDCGPCAEHPEATPETPEELELAWKEERAERLECSIRADACWRLSNTWDSAWDICGDG